MTTPERVTHGVTELEGDVIRGRNFTAGPPDYAGDMCGRWVEVRWDDGFVCWVPVDSILFNLPAVTTDRGGR